jgi:hypothetical protein
MQQEHRQRLLEAGLRRWQVGEIAARIAHLYYSQYQRASDTALLSEAFVFYHAVLDRAYFLDEHLGAGASTKHLRFLARFLLVALILARRAHTVPLLASRIRALLDESKKTLQAKSLSLRLPFLLSRFQTLCSFSDWLIFWNAAGIRLQGVEAHRARNHEVSQGRLALHEHETAQVQLRV